MSIGADDLFGGEKPAPLPLDPAPSIRTLLMVAGPLNLLGPFLCTSVPGALLSLWAWYRADEAVARVETGALPDQYGVHLRVLKNTTFANLMACLVLLVVQVVAFMLGLYDQVLELILMLWQGM